MWWCSVRRGILCYQLMAILVLFVATAAAQEAQIRIVLAGDSTVTDHAGWGSGFRILLQDTAECINLAKSGRSSRSFRAEGFWKQCLDAKPDYLLIQFGHNDQPGKGPERESAADGAFREHLKGFVDEAMASGIQPILITSLTRRRWTQDGRIQSSLADYALATIDVAREKNVPVIDLHQKSIQQCEAVGPTAFRAFEPMTECGADHTHLNAEGGLAVAELVVSELVQRVPALQPHVLMDQVAAARVPRQYQTRLTSGALTVREDSDTITVSSQKRVLLVYNKTSPAVPDGIDPVYHRSGFLHPVLSPSGAVVTATFPVDHPHQHGIFSAWVNTTWNDRPLNFWDLAGGTGRVLHQSVRSTFLQDGAVGFEVTLIHRAQQTPVVDILQERWRITVYPVSESVLKFDLHTAQQNLTDLPLTVNQYHYGGMALRGPVAWLSPKDGGDAASSESTRTDCQLINDQGTDRIAGNHVRTRWVSMSGMSKNRPVTITVMSHRENLRAPQAARLHPTKPYLSFTPCVDEPFVIERSKPLQGRYRYLVTDAAPDQAWIQEQWDLWHATAE